MFLIIRSVKFCIVLKIPQYPRKKFVAAACDHYSETEPKAAAKSQRDKMKRFKNTSDSNFTLIQVSLVLGHLITIYY